MLSGCGVVYVESINAGTRISECVAVFGEFAGILHASRGHWYASVLNTNVGSGAVRSSEDLGVAADGKSARMGRGPT